MASLELYGIGHYGVRRLRSISYNEESALWRARFGASLQRLADGDGTETDLRRMIDLAQRAGDHDLAQQMLDLLIGSSA